jgi:hypothetical protein
MNHPKALLMSMVLRRYHLVLICSLIRHSSGKPRTQGLNLCCLYILTIGKHFWRPQRFLRENTKWSLRRPVQKTLMDSELLGLAASTRRSNHSILC